MAFGHCHLPLLGQTNGLGLYAVFEFFSLSGFLMTRVPHEKWPRFALLSRRMPVSDPDAPTS